MPCERLQKLQWERSAALKILEMTFQEFTHELSSRHGKGKFHAAALFRELYGHPNSTIAKDGTVATSPEPAHRIRQDINISPGRVVSESREGESIKFITRLTDGLEIETVCLAMDRHKTVCISSQVGCRMGCRFCETAGMGFFRNLTTEEIVGQVWAARRRYAPEIRNVVFMGMGEPLDNFDNVVQSIRVINDQRGLDVALRRITVSTAGKTDAIAKLGKLNFGRLHLTVSLNASNDQVRSYLMPINRSMPMGLLRQALMDFPMVPGTLFMIEYVLIPGINDLEMHARELAEFLRPLPAKINLIPYNPGSQALFRKPSEAEITRFSDDLKREKMLVIRRATRGRMIMAACGQLGGGRQREADAADIFSQT
jgi:23S rRNA (adenine2503-C2)-methyltransferase